MSGVVQLASRRHVDAPAPASIIIAADDRIVRMPEAVRRSGLSIATIYRRCDRGEFAPKISLGGSSVGFRESDFAAWLASRGRVGAQ